jgi:hypothetical protein
MPFDSFQTSGNSPGSKSSDTRTARYRFFGEASHAVLWADPTRHIQDNSSWSGDGPIHNAEAV